MRFTAVILMLASLYSEAEDRVLKNSPLRGWSKPPVFSEPLFAKASDLDLDDLQNQLNSVLRSKGLDEKAIQQKMREMSQGVPSSKFQQPLGDSIESVPGMSKEEFQELKSFVDQTLKKHGVSHQDISDMARSIDQLTQ